MAKWENCIELSLARKLEQLNEINKKIVKKDEEVKEVHDAIMDVEDPKSIILKEATRKVQKQRYQESIIEKYIDVSP